MGPDLTTTPDAEGVRALARSSPWRWRTLRFVHRVTWPGGDRHRQPVRAWLRRPNRLRVESLDGRVRVAGTHSPPVAGSWLMPDGHPVTDEPVDVVRDGGWTLLSSGPLGADELDEQDPVQTDVGRAGPQRRWRHGDSRLPPMREDGLVSERAAHDADFDAPMLDSYLWVAMLDPVELAEGGLDDDLQPRSPATITDVVEVEHHGRRAWQAELVATAAYDPRCPCCPLLLHTDTDLPPPAGVVLADNHVVRLDVQTGVCVSVLQLGGTHHGWELDVEIEAVDEPMPDDLFDPTGLTG